MWGRPAPERPFQDYLCSYPVLLEQNDMRIQSAAQRLACLVLGIGIAVPATMQSSAQSDPAANNAVEPSRVVERVDDARRVTLTGNPHPMARPRYDQGLADPQLP